jgi:hypothetical protein
MYQSGSVVLPDGFSYKIKSVTQPENGSIEKVSDYVYKYTPSDKLKSGKIYVTLEITKDDNAFAVQDVDLVLEFEQTHETTKYVLEKTVYNYTENFYDSETGKFTTTAAQAFENNFEGYSSVTSGDNVNPTLNGRVVQDSNSDVWYIDTLQDDGNNTGDGVADANVKTQVIVVSGKIYVDEDGKYRIALRGRKNVALFISTDGGNTYTKAAEYLSESNTADFTNEDGTYTDLELEEGQWVYFKAVLIRYYGESRNAFVGIGWGKWTDAEGDMDIEYDEEGNPVYSEDYVAPTVSVGYATAYRNSYVQLETEEFTSDYLYTREYSYTYNGITTYDVKQELITANCVFSEGWGHKLESLVDGDNGTYAHTDYAPSESRPVVFEAKLAEEITANRVIFDGSHNSERSFLPKDFKIYVSSDGETWQLVCDVTDSSMSEDCWQVTAMLDGTYTFSYYRVVITATQKEYIALRRIIFQNYVVVLEGGNQLSPDDDRFTYKESTDWTVRSTYSSFGHVYVGQEGATLEFEFEGTRFGILSVASLGANFKVEIDGKEVSSIELVEMGKIGASYISELLSEGKHTVKITCLGEANIDSIVIW